MSEKNINGFTLIEILFVIIILSVIVGLSIPNFSKFHRQLLLKQASSDVTFLMKRAQTRAMSQGCDLRMSFDRDHSALWVEQKKDNAYVRMTGELGRIVQLPTEIRVETKGLPVYFEPNGRMSKAAISVCDDKNCILISTKEMYGNIKTSEWGAK
ncbi:MAG: prepilin-type N-terminal cleavage/methylation domain-containing protein [Candidatus Omnitrophica bacterium]|nr:prepilin-type N-terminal cleavage/methylation domain-containing protein [Candidatus Omnitrophota bacterium]